MFRAGLLQNGPSRIRHIQVDQSAGKVESAAEVMTLWCGKQSVTQLRSYKKSYV